MPPPAEQTSPSDELDEIAASVEAAEPSSQPEELQGDEPDLSDDRYVFEYGDVRVEAEHLHAPDEVRELGGCSPTSSWTTRPPPELADEARAEMCPWSPSRFGAASTAAPDQVGAEAGRRAVSSAAGTTTTCRPSRTHQLSTFLRGGPAVTHDRSASSAVASSDSAEALPAGVDLASYGEGPREECGVFGVYAPDEDVATLTYFALYALQHRGQESAGIAVSDGRRLVVHKDMGLVNQVFKDTNLAALQGNIAIGHCRYSTTGASSWVNAQPTYHDTPTGGGITLGHNGNLVNTAELARELDVPASNDSEIMAALLARDADVSLEEAIVRNAPSLKGAFSVVVMDEQRIHAFRDPNGFRPLQIGRLPAGGWVVASETAALDIVGAVYVRDVEPGEVVTIDGNGIHAQRFADATPTFCLFEWVYLARPDHRQDGGSVLYARRNMGRQLAIEAPVEADIVIPVPEAGRDAAAGYAEEAGLPFADGLVKNRYVGRTFIQPTQSLRQLGIKLKLSPVREVVEGQRLVVVDDSIVRGNTSRQLVAMLREAGAAEVHLRITSPPIKNPCYYGIDMATRAELIGADLTVDEIRDFVGADSLHYITLDGLIDASPTPRDALCTACFSGDYPVPVPGEHEQLAQIKFDFDGNGNGGAGSDVAADPGHAMADAREGRTIEEPS